MVHQGWSQATTCSLSEQSLSFQVYPRLPCFHDEQRHNEENRVLFLIQAMLGHVFLHIILFLQPHFSSRYIKSLFIEDGGRAWKCSG